MIVGDRAHVSTTISRHGIVRFCTNHPEQDFEMEDSKIADISNTGINGSNDSDLGDSNSDGSQVRVIVHLVTLSVLVLTGCRLCAHRS